MKSFEQFKDADEALEYLAKEKERKQNEASSSSNLRMNRFFLAHGQESNIVFIDDLKFPVYEHEFWMFNESAGKKLPVYLTCIQGIEGECPGDDAKKPYFALVTTVIDLYPKNKKGETLNPRKRLFVAKSGSSERVLTRQKNQGTLVGRVFWVKRSNDQKAEKTGTDIDYVKDADWDKLKKFAPEGTDPDEWLQPYNYAEIFKPLSVDEFRKALGMQAPVGGSQDEQPDIPTSSEESGGNEGKEQVSSLQDLI